MSYTETDLAKTDPAKTYHHGDLRAELLKAARNKLNAEGYEVLSLRELARDLGVVRSAPYAHFANREALLRALGAQGAHELLVAFQAAHAQPLGAQHRLADVCRIHLDFADAQPEMYRLMLMAPVAPDAETMIDPEKTLAVLEDLIAQVMASANPGAARNTAIACLSVLHGFCMLRIHRRLMPDVDPVDAAAQIVASTVRLAQIS